MQNILQLNSVEMAENIYETLLSLIKQALKKRPNQYFLCKLYFE